MTFEVIEWNEERSPPWVHNTIQGENLIVSPDIQTHIDAILKNPDNCVDYILGLEEELRKKVLEVFHQIQRILNLL